MKVRAVWVMWAVLGAVSSAGAGEMDLATGQYRLTVRTEMAGMPAGMGEQTLAHCVTAEEVADPGRFVQSDSSGQEGCAARVERVAGETLSYVLECPGQGMRGEGEYHFARDSYTGRFTATMTDPGSGQAMSFTTHVEGKRVGECKN